jgi:hypothetical protein
MILNLLYKNLNFEQGSHKIWTELTRITHIIKIKWLPLKVNMCSHIKIYQAANEHANRFDKLNHKFAETEKFRFI